MGIIWLIIMTVTICAMVFGIRYMHSREIMAMIEKGLNPNLKPERPRPAPFRSLKWGLLLVGAGIGLFLAYLLDNTMLYKVGHEIGRYSGGEYEAKWRQCKYLFRADRDRRRDGADHVVPDREEGTAR